MLGSEPANTCIRSVCCDSLGGEFGSGAKTLVGAGDRVADRAVDLMVQNFGSDADRTGNGAFARRTVRLHHHAVEPDQGSAAVSFRIHPAFNVAKCRLGEQGAELTPRVGG